jgi:hypothetical protein
MSTTLTGRESSDLNVQQIYNYKAHAESEGVKVHAIETPLGSIELTFDGLDVDGTKYGRIWTLTGLTVNRTEHQLIGRYRLNKGYGRWVKATDRGGMDWVLYDHPYLSVDGYPGLRRADGGTITENARTKIGVELGKAVADYIKGSDVGAEALVNAREIAALDKERKARSERDTAARHIRDAEKLEAEAAAIRAGGQFQPVK